MCTVHCAGSWGGAGGGAGTGHRVLCKQLLLQGHLYDPRGEFFIVREEEGEGEESVMVGEGDLSKSRR